MNTRHREPPIDSQAIDELRWQAQEKARRGDADADPDELRIARALRRAPALDLPVDFATRVAAIARVQAVANSVLEHHLLRGLVVVFAVSAAVVVGWYGRGWVATLSASLPGGSDAVGWSGVAALCLLGNWGLGALRTHLGRGVQATA